MPAHIDEQQIDPWPDGRSFVLSPAASPLRPGARRGRPVEQAIPSMRTDGMLRRRQPRAVAASCSSDSMAAHRRPRRCCSCGSDKKHLHCRGKRHLFPQCERFFVELSTAQAVAAVACGSLVGIRHLPVCRPMPSVARYVAGPWSAPPPDLFPSAAHRIHRDRACALARPRRARKRSRGGRSSDGGP